MSQYKQPAEYKNIKRGRIVEGLTGSPHGGDAGNVYEDTYNSIRKNFEKLRTSGIFHDVLKFMASGEAFSKHHEDIGSRARKLGIEMNAGATDVYRQVARQWSTGTNGMFHSDFTPMFLLDAGMPCTHAAYQKTGEKIAKFLTDHPDMRTQFFAMSQKPDLFINTHEVFPVGERDTRMARQFEQAVRKTGFDGMSQPVVAAILKHNPELAAVPALA